MSDHQRLTEVKTAMLLHVPFFASLMMDMMNIVITKDSGLWDQLGTPPTAATDGKTIWFYDDYLTSLPVEQGVALMCHEISHMMWMHMPRAAVFKDSGFEGSAFDMRLWNMAGDYVINDMITNSRIGVLPPGGLLDKRFNSGMLTDEVYRQLLQDQSQNGEPLPGNTLDAHIAESTAVSEVELRRAIATASEAAKAMGKMPAGLERFVEGILNPRIPWQEKLRHCITRAVSRSSTTWASPHRRRLVTQNVYLPSYTGHGAGVVAVVFDTSGSIGARELQAYMSELADILGTCRPEKVWLLSCDTQVYEDSIHELEEGYDVASHPPLLRGGGGTSFIPPFKWLAAQGIEPACVIYLTDMYGTFPEPQPFPVIWCATSSIKAPFGETIQLDVAGVS